MDQLGPAERGDGEEETSGGGVEVVIVGALLLEMWRMVSLWEIIFWGVI
jgi:hypothetical protein